MFGALNPKAARLRSKLDHVRCLSLSLSILGHGQNAFTLGPLNLAASEANQLVCLPMTGMTRMTLHVSRVFLFEVKCLYTAGLPTLGASQGQNLREGWLGEASRKTRGFANWFCNRSYTLSCPSRIGSACVKSKSLRQRLREPSPQIMHHTNAFANIW